MPCDHGQYLPPGEQLIIDCIPCAPGTADEDLDPATVCTACGPASYAPEGASGSCNEDLLCPEGTFGNDTSAATPCAPCPPGSFSLRGALNCTECAVGYIDHDQNGATACRLCQQPGTYVPAGSAGSCGDYLCPAGTTDHDSRAETPCMPCGNGTYVPRGSSGPCVLFACEEGTVDEDRDPSTPCFSLSSCKAGAFLREGVCVDCPEGSTDHDRSAETPCVVCGNGTYVPEGSAGTCAERSCATGTTDHDGLPGTPCQPCSADA